MKKIISAAMFCAILLASCSSDDAEQTIAGAMPAYTAQTELHGGARTIVDANRNVLWSENDNIAIFQKSSLSDEYVLSAGAGTQNGSFKYVEQQTGQYPDFSAGTEISHNAAIFPYRADYVMSNVKGGFKFENIQFPAIQHLGEGYMDKKALPMVAVSEDTNLKFKNIGGMLRLQLLIGSTLPYKIKIKGLGNEKIAGTATVTTGIDGAEPAMTLNDAGASSEIELNFIPDINRDMSKPMDFFAVMPVMKFAKGIQIEAYDEHGALITTLKTLPCEIKRNDILVMPPVQL